MDTAVQLLPAAVRRLRDAHLPAHLGNGCADLRLAQRERDLLARELRLHAKSPARFSFDLARFLSFSLEAFSGTGSTCERYRMGR